MSPEALNEIPKWVFLIPVLFVTILYMPTILWLVDSWQTDPFYSHGFVVPCISAFLAWRIHRKTSSGSDQNPEWRWVTVIAVGIVIHLFAISLRLYFLSAVSVLLVVSGLIGGLWGTESVKRYLFPICFLAFMIPLPFLEYLSLYFAAISAVCVACLVNIFGMQVTTIGAELVIPGVTFVIGLPCSGLRSIITLIIPIAIILFLLEVPFTTKVLLSLLVLPIAFLSNMFRIGLLILVAQHLGESVALGFYHSFYGVMTIIVAFLFYLGILHTFGFTTFRQL